MEKIPAIDSFENNEKLENNLWEEIKYKIIDSLEPILQPLGQGRVKEIDTEYTKLEARADAERELSKKVGEFFKSLIPEGLRDVDKENNPQNKRLNFITLEDNSKRYKLLEINTKGLSREEYIKNKKEVLGKSLHGRNRYQFQGEVVETKHANGEISQGKNSAYLQQGGENLIYERVDNSLNSTEQSNWVFADLVIQNIDNGVTLDLNALLPDNFRFVPAYMQRASYQSDETSATGILYKQQSVADLMDYRMDKNIDDFSAAPMEQTVQYGNLKGPGRMLILFHEIAHSWQMNYYNTANKGKNGFQRHYQQTISLLDKLDLMPEGTGQISPEEIQQELENIDVVCEDLKGTTSPIKEPGIINIPNTFYRSAQAIRYILENDKDIEESFRTILQSRLQSFEKKIRFYPVKSKILQEKLDSYIAEERDAWAHAIRTVRYLRHNGLDVEPELKNIDKIKEVIDPCLSSYQQSVDALITREETEYRFLRPAKNK